MFYIAICDDQSKQLEQIRAATENYFAERPQYTAEIMTYDNSFLLLESIEQNDNYDILLLDICMPGINGIQVAQEVRNRKSKCQIVFLTTSDEFAVDAFALKAAHYLLKPFGRQQFEEALDRVVAYIIKQEQSNITLKLVGGGIQSVDLQDILYVEGSVHVQNVFMANDTCIEVRQTMAQMQEILDTASPKQFVCPFKGYIVNIRSISTLQPKQLILKNRKAIPIARGGFRELQDAYFEFMFAKEVSV